MIFKNDKNALKEYCNLLFNNSESSNLHSKVNIGFHLDYYGDIINQSPGQCPECEDNPDKGHNTFRKLKLDLSTKIDKNIIDGNLVIQILTFCMMLDRDGKKFNVYEKDRNALLIKFLSLLETNNLLGTKYRLCNFDNFIVTEQNKELFEMLQEYWYGSYKAVRSGIGIYLWGEPGTGKTHAMYALANELVYENRHTVYFTSILDILNGIKKNFTDIEEQENIKERAKDAQFLFLDDIGAEQLKDDSDWYKSIIYEIIDYRYRQNKSTIFSSNYSKTELVEKRHYDERLAQRIMEMCPLEYHMAGEPMRIACAKKRKETVRGFINDEEGYSFTSLMESIAPWWARFQAEFECEYKE